MTQPNQHALADSRFSHAGARYVTSAVHASGADLDRIAARARETAPARALDLGAGGGHVGYAMAPFAQAVIAADLSATMLETVRAEAARRGIANIETVATPAEALPFDSASFDMLACRFSTHHWRDAMAGLAEARRVLKRGAPALFVDVVAPGSAMADTHLQAVELLRDASHVRDYSAAQWARMLELAGFGIEAVVPSRLRMDFADWTGRMDTSEANKAAIRALQDGAPREVADHFAIEGDGSFTIDVLLIEAR